MIRIIAPAAAQQNGARCDKTGWHLSSELVVPDNITIVLLPPKCPELNPQENVWQYMRDNWLSNRVFDNDNALLNHCCDAWNKLEAQPCWCGRPPTASIVPE